MTAPGLHVDVSLPLERFDLKVRLEAGRGTTGIFGPSGAGKTTLLEVVAGLRRAGGTLRFGGATWLDSAAGLFVPAEARGVGYVPQSGLLFPHWTVRANVMAGAGRRNGRGEADPAEVIRVLDLVELQNRRVDDLSGGERQRVALARALCSGPGLLLLDEPLGSIDRALRSRILPYLLEVRERYGIPTLFVSHDAAEIEILCDEVFVMAEGRISASGAPHEIFATAAAGKALPGDAYENVLEGTVESTEEEIARVRTGAGPVVVITAPPGLSRGARVTVGIRAAEIMIALDEAHGLSARNVIPGTVRSIEAVEGGDMVRVEPGGSRADIAVMVTDAARKALDLHEGKSVLLVAKARSFHLLAAR